MDAVSLKLARNYTNEKLNSLPSNAPTKTVTFDGGIYSVGSDVVNGQVSVVLRGRTATNLVKNGSFENNSTNWNNIDGAISISNEKSYAGTKAVKKVLNNAANGHSQTINMIVGHKYYVSSMMYISSYTSGTPRMRLSAHNINVFASTTKINQWQRLSTIIDNSVSIETVTFAEPVLATLTLYTDAVMAIDLTVTFGAGKEPTKEQCDQIFTNWFDGTKSTVCASRLKSVGKNLFDGTFKKDTYIDVNGNFSTQVGTRTTNKIEVMSGKQYTISGGNRTTIRIEDAYGSKIFNEQNAITPRVITIPQNGKYLYVYYSTDGTHSSFQVEQNTVATPYEPYKESTQYMPNVGELRSLPNGTKDELNVVTGVKTQRIGNKTNVASGTVIDYADMATAGQFVAYYADGTQQVGVKGDTLTALAVSLIYQLAEPVVTKLPAQAPLQVFENGTVYVEPLGDPSETTVPSVEMTIPIGTSNKFGVASHDYDGAAADWVLTNSESKCFLLTVSNAGGSANIIAPDAPGVMYAISNASGQTVTIKISGGTGVAITNAKTVLVIHNGTDYTALTAEL